MTAVFDAYVRYYDLLYSGKDYPGEAEYVATGIRQRAPRCVRLLELGCGTGAHAEHLARMGFHIHGVDVSERMIERAMNRRAKLPHEMQERLSFSCGDVRTARTGETYDAVISLFHVMSYQVANADLDSSFRTAAAHLREGGVFFFDFWYGPAVLTQRPETRIRRMEDSRTKVIRLAESSLDENANTVDVNFTVYVEDVVNGVRGEIMETHRMRYLFLPEIELMLSAAGFCDVTSSEWLTDRPPTVSTWSVCVSAQKAGSALLGSR